MLDNLEFVESLKALPKNESPPRIIKISGAAVTSSFERSALERANST